MRPEFHKEAAYLKQLNLERFVEQDEVEQFCALVVRSYGLDYDDFISDKKAVAIL